MPSTNVSSASPRSRGFGRAPSGGKNQGSQIVTTVIPAGRTLTVFQSGKEFYLVLATAAVFIKPNNGDNNQFTQGTGLVVSDGSEFNSVEVMNPNAFSVVIQMFVGYGGYLDNRTILFNPLISNVVFPTSPAANTANEIDIVDRSGAAITDINGVEWLALQRIGIYISNVDLAVVYNLLDFPTRTLVALSIQPKTEILFQASGDLAMKVPSGNINAVVSEVYAAVAPTN